MAAPGAARSGRPDAAPRDVRVRVRDVSVQHTICHRLIRLTLQASHDIRELRGTHESDDLAWVAGLIEGEGYFVTETSARGYIRVRIGVTSTDLDVLEHLQTLAPHSCIQGPYKPARTSYDLICTVPPLPDPHAAAAIRDGLTVQPVRRSPKPQFSIRPASCAPAAVPVAGLSSTTPISVRPFLVASNRRQCPASSVYPSLIPSAP